MKKIILMLIVACFVTITKGQSVTTIKSFCDSIADGSIPAVMVTEVPKYPGGEDAMNTFIQDNIKLPEAKEITSNPIHAMLHINAKGHVENLCVFENYFGRRTNIDSTPIGEEIKRVIYLMPDWEPAKQNDKIVSVNFLVAIKLKKTAHNN